MEDLIRFIAKDVLTKKELRNLDEEFVIERIKIFLKKHKRIKEKLEQRKQFNLKRAKEYKEIIKAVRAELREVYGVFILKEHFKLGELLDKLRKNPCLENHNKILESHKSSKERLPYYALVYKRIFEIIGVPKRIVDLGCGLNPFSYPYIKFKPEYVACDLAKKDLEFIKEYFKIMRIKGVIKRVDLAKDCQDKLKEIIKKEDVVFLLKTVDSLEAIKKNISKDLLRSIPARFIVVSFSTKSLGGKKRIRRERRTWFERFVKKLGYKITIFEIPGEIFYVLTKQA
ncbi:MAG TPA: hypothetical protein ENL16_00355 [Candidatus Woesearchaeota archaeon]|nr:hypothetical protein [Candidatus Woesearchaeota archaeon]